MHAMSIVCADVNGEENGALYRKAVFFARAQKKQKPVKKSKKNAKKAKQTQQKSKKKSKHTQTRHDTTASKQRRK
jgi:hypothetical protein